MESTAIRALRGYLRIARQFQLSNEERVEMCRKALEVAARDAERELVLQVLERYPSTETLQLAREVAKTPSLADDANKTSMAIVQRLVRRSDGSVDAEELLSMIGQEPVEVEIIRADYGAGSDTKDVTDILRKHTGKLPWVSLPSPSFNASFGGDPAPGVPKKLNVEYRINGDLGQASFTENSTIILPRAIRRMIAATFRCFVYPCSTSNRQSTEIAFTTVC